MPELVMPDGHTINVGEPSDELKALGVIAQNQAAIHAVLTQIGRQLEIQLRIQCGADTKSLWKQRVQESDRLNAEAQAEAQQELEEEQEAEQEVDEDA